MDTLISRPPLLFCMNWRAMDGLPFEPSQRLAVISAAGYEGVQFVDALTPQQDRDCDRLRLWRCSSGRVNSPAEALQLAQRFADEGQNCATLHVGWGLENDAEAERLLDAVIEASHATRVPLYVETHRATIFQDMWRTMKFVAKFPELLLNADFSHWYTGQEMVYGGFERKLEFIRPIMERVRFIHGRIADPGCIQVAVPLADAESPIHVEHFRELWSAAITAFRHSAEKTMRLPFVPELLAPSIYYARTIRSSTGASVELTDRWAESLQLCKIANECLGADPE